VEKRLTENKITGKIKGYEKAQLPFIRKIENGVNYV
jgi:hypothetical protein